MAKRAVSAPACAGVTGGYDPLGAAPSFQKRNSPVHPVSAHPRAGGGGVGIGEHGGFVQRALLSSPAFRGGGAGAIA